MVDLLHLSLRELKVVLLDQNCDDIDKMEQLHVVIWLVISEDGLKLVVLHSLRAQVVNVKVDDGTQNFEQVVAVGVLANILDFLVSDHYVLRRVNKVLIQRIRVCWQET